MCGIAGEAARSGRHVPPVDVARRMCDAIYHRGPDDEGIHHEPAAMLGMRRLAIMDPAGGEQPIYNEQRDICTVVNGEIYNYRDLRRELEGRGHVFRSSSDVECVVHAYEEYGTECFSRLRGMFAIAIWDGRSRSLVLARDRFGKKPLFFAETPRGLAFASEIKSLLQHPEIDADIDRSVIGDYLMFGYVPTPRSILSGIRKLKPGHHLVFHEGFTRIRRYWSLDFLPKFDANESELTDMLEHRLDNAVSARLASDVPFGAFLSGGVDSSLVVAMMSRHMNVPVQTFSIGFDDARYDESGDARRISKYLGTEHHELIVKPDALEMLERIAWYLDEPMADSSIIPTYLVSRLASSNVKMVLTGDGGDEMFGGYERYARYHQLMAIKETGVSALAPLLQRIAELVPSRLGKRASRAFSRLTMRPPDDYISSVASVTPQLAASLVSAVAGRPESYGAMREHFARPDQGTGALDSVLQGDIQTYLLDDILVKVDRASMANSLEARAPLLDHHLAEFAARLPEHLKVRRGTTKYLLKRVAERYLPADCVHRKKQGFAVPLARWLREDLAELLMDTVHSREFAERGVFDVAAARKLAVEHVNGRRDNSMVLWSLLVFESWAQRYVSANATRPAGAPVQELRPAAS